MTAALENETQTSETGREERRAAGVAFGAHILHDGYTDLIYVLLPVWQAEFGLSYAALGAMKTVFSGTLAAFQVPSGMLAERLGVAVVLAAGTALAGLGYVLAGFSSGLAFLIAALFVGGLGASTQHPLASTLISRAFPGARSFRALGTYNFSGDIGKMLVPAAGAFLLVSLSWRHTVMLLGSIGLVAAVAILMVTPRFRVEAAHPKEAKAAAGSSAARHRLAFPMLMAIGILDSATRMVFLTFLPFLLTAKGASLPTIGISLTLVFAGGATGKLVCSYLGSRIGGVATVWLTEGVTALGIAAALVLPLEAIMVLLPVVGLGLNGTSSVLYGSVPALVDPERRTRAFSIFYTCVIGSGAVAPAIFGVINDAAGLTITLLLAAGMALLTLPITLLLKPALDEVET